MRGFTTKLAECQMYVRMHLVEARAGSKTVRGFTLIELMVVLAIIVTITTIALTSQSSFNKTLILANTAYDIALTLRSAESFGIGSRATGSMTNSCMANAGYGVHFLREASDSFVLFADTSPTTPCSTPDQKPGDTIYTSADTRVQTYMLGNSIVVSNFCAYSSASGSCENQSGSYGGGLSSLDIVFARPNPDASISAGGFSYTTACLTITSPQGGSPRYIRVESSGAIIANASSCP